MSVQRMVIKPFDELSPKELFDVLRLRCEVFIVEQNCPYQDPDKKDPVSLHLMAFDFNKELKGYLRLVPPGISYSEASIGRVCTALSERRSGLGKNLMAEGIKLAADRGWKSLRISAQAYLEKFYEGYGFRSVTEPYLEDNIPHIEMLREG